MGSTTWVCNLNSPVIALRSRSYKIYRPRIYPGMGKICTTIQQRGSLPIYSLSDLDNLPLITINGLYFSTKFGGVSIGSVSSASSTPSKVCYCKTNKWLSQHRASFHPLISCTKVQHWPNTYSLSSGGIHPWNFSISRGTLGDVSGLSLPTRKWSAFS